MNCFICDAKIVEPFAFSNLFEAPQLLCETCRAQLLSCRLNDDARCSYCKGWLIEGNCMTCEHLSDYTTRFDHIYASYCYDGLMKEIIQRYKFMKDVALAEVLARYIEWPKAQYDIVIPMPSSPQNDALRTFNPVKYVLQSKGMQFHELLVMENRHKQFDLSKKERFCIENSIKTTNEKNLENKRILLVDDIYTTGKTAHNAAIKLFSAKVRKLDMLTFAR
ncbi:MULTISPECIES: ComF family protein [unclassified Staphylococcus]|uniref:ComF family protein n=1 Tax=unclassified Staphylococcus TaxID=91994 RepID=UPI0021D06481|nr:MULTISPECIES: ComF family protein [unclassified Staphylococcus]UXR78753.1 ComF family protein [Staphylococcus sp. IVB6227]UXR82912.1 ComF family protein [Staphylococcus sp. IVB6214]